MRVIAITAALLGSAGRAHGQPVEPAPTTEPGDEAVDLAALGLDTDTGELDERINIYAFADVQYGISNFDKDLALVKDMRGFAAGSLNVYMSRRLSSKWSALAEVKYLYLPNGGRDAQGQVIDTGVADPTNFYRTQRLNGLSIERAHLDYQVHPLVTLRAGRFLTPYGIWNIDHGSPTIIAAYRPFTIGEALFPEHQTGLAMFGKRQLGPRTQVGYHVTVTNGRSATEANNDLDRRPAVGARLDLETRQLGMLKLGVSGYAGRATELAQTMGAATSVYDEYSAGFDAQWTRRGAHVQTELLFNERRYLEGQRAMRGSGFQPDSRAFGGYVLAGYRLDALWSVMPYVMFEYNDGHPNLAVDRQVAYTVGLNFRPLPTVVLKLHANTAQMHGAGILEGTRIDNFISQICWVF